jgi:hypothetical protein
MQEGRPEDRPMTTPAPVFEAARRPRMPLTIDLAAGVIQAGGHRASFDPAADDAIELAYLRLVRRMRDVHREPAFVLRSDDVEALAVVLRRDAVTVLDRLGELMGATVTQRRSMVTAFLAGALLIAVATGSVALGGDDGPAPTPEAPVAADRFEPTADGGRTTADATAPATDDAVDDDAGTETAPPTDEPAGTGAAASPAVGSPVTSPPPVGTSPSPASDEGRSTAPRDPRPAPAPPSSGGPEGGGDPPAPARPDVPARPDAPVPVVGEPDAWSWDAPEVDQPGAIIDIPSEPEVVQPGATIDLPGDDPEVGAA